MEDSDATKPLKRSEADEPPSTTKTRRRDALPRRPPACDAPPPRCSKVCRRRPPTPHLLKCQRTLAFARAELGRAARATARARGTRGALALAIYAEVGGGDARVVEVAALLRTSATTSTSTPRGRGPRLH